MKRSLIHSARSLQVAAMPMLLIATATGCHRKETASTAPQEPAVTANQVVFPANAPELATLALADAKACPEGSVRFNGRITWDDNVTVRVFSPFGGRVLRVEGELGTRVEKDAPLASIASAEFGQAQADMRRATTDLSLAERSLARLRELFEHGAAAAKDVASAEADFGRAQSEATRARARLALYGAAPEALDNHFEMRSPIAGIIVERNISAGQEVRPDQMLAGLDRIAAPLFVVTDPTRLWVLLDVPEAELARIQTGQTVMVRCATMPGRSFPARLEVVSDALDPLTRTARVRASAANNERLLKSEMLVSVGVPSPAPDAVEVPARAVFFFADHHYAFAALDPNKFERREVHVGPARDGVVQVLDGLRSGERVVADGALLLEKIWEQGTDAASRNAERVRAGLDQPGRTLAVATAVRGSGSSR